MLGSVLFYVVIAVLIFGVLIATHELGHFATAKPVSYTHLDVYKRQALFSERKIHSSLLSQNSFSLSGSIPDILHIPVPS